MLKKIISIAVIAAMICTVFAGCTTEDVALFKALQKVPESSITKQVATFDITVEEPMSSTVTFDYGDGDSYTYEDDMSGLNYLMQLYSGFLSITQMESVTTKSGNVAETKLTYTLPDASFSFSAWAQADDNGQMKSAVMTLPSYVRPLLPASISKKQYISFDMAKYMEEAMASLSDIGVIGGADGPTSIVTTTTAPNPELMTGMLTNAISNEAVIDQFAAILDVSIVSGVETSGNNTTYTVKLDGSTLKSIIKGIISSLSKDEIAPMLTLMTGMSAQDMKDGINSIDTDVIGDFIINTGIFDNGITTKYTVSGDGYVVHTEQDIDLNIDLPRIVNAAIDFAATLGDITPEEAAEQKANDTITGKFKVAANIVSDVTSINAALDVKMPQLTEENCIDIISDIEEYAEYQNAYYEWRYSWYDDQAEIAYADMHVPGEHLTLRNNDTGVEISVVPKTRSELDPEYVSDYDDYYYYYNNTIFVPITDLAKVFDDVLSVSWNDEFMGVEVRYMFYDEEYVDILLNSNGRELYYNAEDDSIYYEKFDYVLSYLSDYQFAADGKLYVSLSYFNGDMDYRSRFEGDKYCYTSWENAQFQSDMDLSGNVLYELENMFY